MRRLAEPLVAVLRRALSAAATRLILRHDSESHTRGKPRRVRAFLGLLLLIQHPRAPVPRFVRLLVEEMFVRIALFYVARRNHRFPASLARFVALRRPERSLPRLLLAHIYVQMATRDPANDGLVSLRRGLRDHPEADLDPSYDRTLLRRAVELLCRVPLDDRDARRFRTSYVFSDGAVPGDLLVQTLCLLGELDRALAVCKQMGGNPRYCLWAGDILCAQKQRDEGRALRERGIRGLLARTARDGKTVPAGARLLAPARFEPFFRETPAQVDSIPFAPGEPVRVPPDRVYPTALRSYRYDLWRTERGLSLAHAAELRVIQRTGGFGCWRPFTDGSYLLERPYENHYQADRVLTPVENLRGCRFVDFYWLLDPSDLPVIEIEGPAIFVGGARNFGHFILDLCPKICALERLGVPRNVPIYVGEIEGVHREILDTLFPGLPFRSLREHTPAEDALLLFRDVRVPSSVPYSVAFGYLRERVRGLVERTRATLRARGRRGPRKVYLSRRSAGTTGRRIENETEVAEGLARHGFEVVCPAELPFEGIVPYLVDAECVISPAGAQDANLIFCPKGVRWVELYPDLWHFNPSLNLQTAMWMFAETDYRRVVGVDVIRDGQGPVAEFPLDRIEEAVREYL